MALNTEYGKEVCALFHYFISFKALLLKYLQAIVLKLNEKQWTDDNWIIIIFRALETDRMNTLIWDTADLDFMEDEKEVN